MADPVLRLGETVDGRGVFRRRHVKSDGRELFLYGYAPHEGAAIAEPEAPGPTGGEWRWHPLRGEWNLYAAHRQGRTFKPAATDDPLAPSVAGRVPTEIPFEDFELAVFENRFPGLHPSAPEVEDALVSKQPARGRCEVVVYGPEAEGNLSAIGQDRRRLLLAAWIDRYEALFEQGCAFVLPFENRGDAVGVTLHHPHGQIYGFDRVPEVSARAAAAFRTGYDLGAELERFGPAYQVAERGGLLAICPPYARFPYECWIVPHRRLAGPWEMVEGERDGFAELIGEMTRRYDVLFGAQTPYMFAIHAAPRGEETTYHMSAQFYPLLRAPGRLKYLASVEQHTGVMTVDVLPETAAAQLRALA